MPPNHRAVLVLKLFCTVSLSIFLAFLCHLCPLPANSIYIKTVKANKSPFPDKGQGTTKIQQLFCNYYHNRGNCPAFDNDYKTWGKRGHFPLAVARNIYAQSAKIWHQIRLQTKIHSLILTKIKITLLVQFTKVKSTPKPSHQESRQISVETLTEDEWLIAIETDGSIIPYKADTCVQENILSKADYQWVKQHPSSANEPSNYQHTMAHPFQLLKNLFLP